MIELSPYLRVVDYDANQYAVERRFIAKTGKKIGEVTWGPVAFVGSVKHLATIARRTYADDAATEARHAAEQAFDLAGFGDVLSALPSKSQQKKASVCFTSPEDEK